WKSGSSSCEPRERRLPAHAVVVDAVAHGLAVALDLALVPAALHAERGLSGHLADVALEVQLPAVGPRVQAAGAIGDALLPAQPLHAMVRARAVAPEAQHDAVAADDVVGAAAVRRGALLAELPHALEERQVAALERPRRDLEQLAGLVARGLR